jgi:DNA repair photolyase
MLHQKQVGSVLNKQKQRDSWFLTEYSVNPYEGCSCNCLYCYVRGSKYGENMEDGIVVKTNCLEILEKQLNARARNSQYGFVAVGSAIDAYMHHEEQWHLTEGTLKLLLKYRFPVFISTKCSLIMRDIELLNEIDKAALLPNDLKPSLNRGVILSVSISTMNNDIANILEPGALSPQERLNILQKLKAQGFLVGVNAIPTLPFLSDTEEELEKTISAAKDAGADYILVGGLTLFGNQPADGKTLYFQFLKRYYPSLVDKYQVMYGNNFFSPKHYLEELSKKSKNLCAKHQIRTSILDEYVQPPVPSEL